MDLERSDLTMRIPEHCSQNNEITEGFGKIELLKASIFSTIGLVIGILLSILWTKEPTTVVFSVVLGSACGYIFTKKDRYSRQSIIDILFDFYKFSKSQKYYEFRR